MLWKDEPEPTFKYCLGRQVDVGSRVHHNTELWTQLMDSPHCSSATKSSSCQKWAKNQKILQDGSYSCQCSTTSHGDLKTMNKNSNLKANFVSIYSPERWSSLRPGSEKKWYSIRECKPQRDWDRVGWTDDDQIWRKRTPNFPCHESIVPRNVAKLAMQGRACIDNLTLVCANKFVDENAYTFDRWSCARRSIAKVPNGKAITTKSSDEVLHWYKILDNGWRRAVLNDKKNTAEFSQFTESVACRGCTKIIWPERLDSREHQNVARIWKSQRKYLQSKYRAEITIESVNKDNSCSWVRISHDLNKLVTDFSNKEYDDNEQETSEMQFEDFAVKMNAIAFANRSKAKAKPRNVLLDIESRTYSTIAFPGSKRLTGLLRHGYLPRNEWNDWVVVIERYLRNEFENSRCWSDDKMMNKMARGGGN